MNKYLFFLSLGFLSIFAIGVDTLKSFSPESVPPTISVSATGEARAAPDTAVIRIGVEERATSSEAAMRAARTAMTSLYDRAAELGLPVDEAETARLSLSPIHAPETTREAYRATNIARFETSDPEIVDALGAVLDTLIVAGGSRIESVNFTLADRSVLDNAARRDAADRARAQAADYAAGLGLSLGPLVSASEGGDGAPPVMMSARGGATPVAPGDVTASARLEAVYELHPALPELIDPDLRLEAPDR